MTSIAVLDAVAHRTLRVDARPAARHGDARHYVQVAVTEFPQLAGQRPIFASKDSETGAFMCGAMFGFDEGENLHLKADGRWEGYRPLNLQRQPFVMLDGKLAVDLDSSRIGGLGERLFDDEGQPTAALRRGQAALEALRPGLAATRAFLDDLVRLRLLTPLSMEFAFDDGSQRRMEDLYTVEPSFLRELPDAEVLALFRKGHLYLIDLMILSLQQLPHLAERKNLRLAGLDEAPQPPAYA